MKALVKAKAEKGLWLQDVPEPVCGANDIAIAIKKTAICGTDLHIYNWDAWAQATIKTPMTIGHEFAGEIIEVGSEVEGFKIGDRVSGEGHLTCGFCRNCRAGVQHLCRNTVGVGVNRTGCFAEKLVIPARNAFLLHDLLTDEVGSLLDPFGNAVHTALAFPLIGEDVLITGAGPIGIMAAAVAKFVGARHVVITDINDYRLSLAKNLNDFYTVNVANQSLEETMKALDMKEGFDVGLEMSGVPSAFDSMLKNMNHGGKIAMLGIFKDTLSFDSSQLIFKGLTIKGIYGREMFETWYKMSSMIQSGLDIMPIVTHRFAARNFELGFAALNSGNAGKVILDWESL